MKEKYAKQLIEKNKQAYNLISKDFDRTRTYLWRELSQFGKYAKDGDSVLDFGCGNGRLIGLFLEKEINYTGVDASEELINLAKQKFQDIFSSKIKKIEFLTVESLKLSFSDESFDSIYSIAAFHHIPTAKMRINLLKEFHRLLKPNGRVILTNWNLWQGRYRKLIFKYAIKKLLGQHKADFKDIFVPWKNQEGKVITERYYHAFTKREFKRLVKKSGFKIEESGYFGGKNGRANLYIVVKKL